MEERRKMSLHERFGVTRRNMGFPHIVIFVITYPSQAALPTLAYLDKRIAELQKHFPLLQCRISGDQTRQPRFVLREKLWEMEDILNSRSYEQMDDIRLKQEYLLGFERDRMAKEDLARPLWQISLFVKEDRLARTHLALSVDHVVTDGKGLQLLLEALLTDSIEDIPYETIGTIPRLEDTVNLNPILSDREAIPEPVWPSERVLQSPTISKPSSSLIHLPTDLIDRLKSVGKIHGVPTLHPILLLSLAVAIWSIANPSHTSSSLFHATPISVRDASLGHAHCTANYTAVCLMPQNIHPDLDFWSEVARIGLFLRSPQGRNSALSAKGQLGHIPDEFDPNRIPEFATGWEELYLTRARSEHPYSCALGLSNLGYMKLPTGAEDMAWSQMASPFAPVLLVSLISCEKGLRAIGGWREGSVLERRDVKKIEAIWEMILVRLTAELEGEKLRVRELLEEGSLHNGPAIRYRLTTSEPRKPTVDADL